MERPKPLELAELITDANLRLSTIYERLQSIDPVLERLDPKLTVWHRLAYYWDFLHKEKTFFDSLKGRKLDYWPAESKGSADVVTDLIFEELDFDVGVSSSGKVVVGITIECYDDKIPDILTPVPICLMPGDNIGLQSEVDISKYYN